PDPPAAAATGSPRRDERPRCRTVVSRIWLRGLIVPLAVAAAALLLWPFAGPVVALATLAVGMFGVAAWHVIQLDVFARWAASPLEEAVPEGRGTWAIAYAALYRRVRLRSARQRDLRLALDRFVSGAEARPERVV